MASAYLLYLHLNFFYFFKGENDGMDNEEEIKGKQIVKYGGPHFAIPTYKLAYVICVIFGNTNVPLLC